MLRHIQCFGVMIYNTKIPRFLGDENLGIFHYLFTRKGFSYEVLLITRNNVACSVKVSEILLMGKQLDLISPASFYCCPKVELYTNRGHRWVPSICGQPKLN